MPRDSVAIGKKAAATLKKNRGPDYFKKLGAKGSKARKKPYYHFKHLQQTNPKALEELGKRTASDYNHKINKEK